MGDKHHWMKLLLLSVLFVYHVFPVQGQAACSSKVPVCRPPATSKSISPTTLEPSAIPPETPEEQAAKVAHLQALFEPHLAACSADQGSCTPEDASAAAAEGGGGGSGAVVSDASDTPPAAVVAAGTVAGGGGGSKSYIPNSAAPPSGQWKPYTGPQSQLTQKLTFLENSRIKIGVDMERTGVISWVSSPTMPGKWKNANLINTWDNGRLLQQSFYGCKDASCWYDRAWLFNPVQAGSWQNLNGVTVKKEVVTGKVIRSSGHGRNWGSQRLVKELLLSQDVSLLNSVIMVNFTMDYNGTDRHPVMTQEVPAVFVNRHFDTLVTYSGTKPFKRDSLKYLFPPARNVYSRTTERWAAYVDNSTGYGLGVFVPAAWTGITGYRTGADDSDRPYDCSYFAHTLKLALTPNLPPLRYQAFITVGRLDEIRAAFNKLAADPRILPPELTKDIAAYLKAPEGVVEGQPDLGRQDMRGRLLIGSDESSSDDGPAAAAGAGSGVQESPPQGVPASGLETEVLARAGGGGLLRTGAAAVGAADDSSGDDGDDDGSGKQGALKVLAAALAAVGGVALVVVGVAAAAVQKKRSRHRAVAVYRNEMAAGSVSAAGGGCEPAASSGDKRVAAEAALEGFEGGAEGPRAAAAVIQ